MTTTMLPSGGGIALVGAPSGDFGDTPPPLQAMQVEMTQDLVDELLESMRSGKPPQILFGRTPVCVPVFAGACRAPVALVLRRAARLTQGKSNHG
jgi:hypothetical protein